jgi:transposase
MSSKQYDIDKTIAEVEKLLDGDKNISPTLRAAVKALILVIKMLSDRLSLNSRNSSKPPSSDPNRELKTRKGKSNNKPGAQNGHIGTTLSPVDDPDAVKHLAIGADLLPEGHYSDQGYESRQVFNISISRHVTEYRAQVVADTQGKQYVAKFPLGVTQPAQYGNSVKAHAVYLSQFQLVPYDRVKAQFAQLYNMPLSTGSIYNFNLNAFSRLAPFIALTKHELTHNQSVLHVDETGVNINGKRHWLHVASNDLWTLIEAHHGRGKEAMDAIGILPDFSGYLVHDHWKPYYRFILCLHVLCNAHHKRELTYAYERDSQHWALEMETLLDEINEVVEAAGGVLTLDECKKWRLKYQNILGKADKECPPPIPDPDKKKRGRLARSKSRNLLERLRDYEADVLRFMAVKEAPFTNNQGERDFRMAKVQQKISGCFRSMQGAETFCAIRSYISTCNKHEVDAGVALECLFNGTWPEFIQEKLDVLNLGAE